MTIARLYDKTRGAVTIRTMLHDAAGQLTAFQTATPKKASDAILKWVRAAVALQPILDSIRTRRNEWLAHLDPRTVADTAGLAMRAKLSIPDLDRAFHETEEIVLDLSSLYEGVIGELKFIGGDDYNTALDWIRKARCTFIENYEKEFGAWTGPRPKDCSGNLLKMI